MTIQIADDLLRSFLPKTASQHDFETFKHICQRTGLDPVLKQIHPVSRKMKRDDGTWGTTITFQTSIDGYRLIAERTGKYSPSRAPTFEYDKDGRVFSATAYIKKQTADGTWHEVSNTAYWCEYAQIKQDGQPTQFWAKMPHLMLAKCAEALTLRQAFPDIYSKLYTDEEMNNSITLSNQQESEISLPDDVSLVEFETFLEGTSKELKTTVKKLKERAIENPGPFWEWFYNHRNKQEMELAS